MLLLVVSLVLDNSSSDGQHIVRVLVELLMTDSSEEQKLNVTMMMTMTGTVLVILNIVLGVYSILI